MRALFGKSPPVALPQMGDARLRLKSVALKRSEVATPETRAQIELLWRAMEGESQGGDTVAVGLAAPQIGWSRRVVAVQSDPLPRTTMINPVLRAHKPEEKILMEESCVSVRGLVGPVTRYKHVVVDYWDEEGASRRLRCSGWFAGLVQHELDHLEGILFVDRVNPKDLAFMGSWDRTRYPSLTKYEDGTFEFD
jgi:peptide deformylase